LKELGKKIALYDKMLADTVRKLHKTSY